MAIKRILHAFVPEQHVGPFDISIAADAGYDVVLPYTNVRPGDVPALIRDTIFSRPPNRHAHTGVLIAGTDVAVAADMFESARNALVRPFEVALLCDPSGAASTTAALVASIERTLQARTGSGLDGRRVAILGSSAVGLCTAVLATRLGAAVTLCQVSDADDPHRAARFCERYQVLLPWLSAQSRSGRVSAIADAEVVIAAGGQGEQVLSCDMLSVAHQLIVAADLNAVPPSGIEGVMALDCDVPVENGEQLYFSLGALAIGDVKYRLQRRLFERMMNDDAPPAVLDFIAACAHADRLLAEAPATAGASDPDRWEAAPPTARSA
jgi:methylene-tetrahydromethanopterin dehydrogenase